MPGSAPWTRISLGKETTPGTPVATTRQFYGAVHGNFELGQTWASHADENRGLRTRPSRAPTLLREFPKFKLQDIDGMGWDDWVIPLSMGLKGGQTGVGAGADKTWTFAVLDTITGNGHNAFSMDVGDDIQNWRLQYVQPEKWTISSDLGGQTHYSGDLFAQRAVKTTRSTPAELQAIKMPAAFWTAKYASSLAGLPGASVETNFLRTWSMDYDPGLKPRFYEDGNTYFGQTVETSKSGTLSMQTESTARAVSEFVDKYTAGTLSFVRLKATGPTLGSTNYSMQWDVPVYWQEPKPISAVDDEINLYDVTGNVAYDPTGAASITCVLVCSLAAVP